MIAHRCAHLRALAVAVLGASALGACHTGPDARGFGPAVTPLGVTVELGTSRGAYEGELLEVRDTAFVIFYPPAPTLVPFTAVRRAKVHQYPASYRGGVPTAEQRAELRLLARHPYGLTPDQLARLLAAYGQRELRLVPP